MDEKRNTGYDLLIVTGPTASGKTALAVNVAGKLNGEIISADSRQVYRKMDIGTGKDYSDYVVDGRQVPYHLIDIADPGYKYNVFEYQHDFLRVYSELKDRDIFPVVCGGSGMYIDSIVAGYRMIEVPPDPELRAKLEGKTMEELSSILSCYRPLHNKTDIDTRKRVIRAIEIGIFSAVNPETRSAFPKLRCLVTGVRYEREAQRRRISERLFERLNSGMVKEVESLLSQGVSSEALMYYGLEYKYITMFLIGEIDYDEMVRSLEIAIHQFAKRQMTWFRGMERKGVAIHWIDGDLPIEDKAGKIMELLPGRTHPQPKG